MEKVNEKSFKVKRIQKYQNEMDKRIKNGIKNIGTVGIGGAAAVLCLSQGINPEQIIHSITMAGLGIGSSLFTVYNLSLLIANIAHCAGIRFKIDDLEAELEKEEGMKR